MQSSYCKLYFPDLLSNPNMISAAEILQGREIKLFNKVGNVENSLYFHVLILKGVKGKHHQPAATPFQFSAHLAHFHLRSLPVPFPPVRERCEMLFNFVSVLQVNPVAGSSQFSCSLLQTL